MKKMHFGTTLILFVGIMEIASWIILEVARAVGFLPPSSVSILPTILFICMPLVFIFTMAIGMKHYSTFLVIAYTKSVMWLGAFLFFFCGAILLWLLYLIEIFVGIEMPLIVLAWIITLSTIICLSYGIWNASRPRITKRTISSMALSKDWKDKTMVLVSDIHLGLIRQGKFLTKVVNLINAQNPDIVFIAGDIIDGPKFPYENELAPLKNLRAPLGVFYTPGNHEAYNQEPDQWKPLVKAATKMLVDEKMLVNGTQIIGLDYASETPSESTAKLLHTGFDKTIPSIVILHDPRHAKALQEAGVSLVLSGHTHRGQFFPMTIIVKLIYKKYTYGQTVYKGNTSITTSGVGTAMTPIRLGTNPEIVVIKIV